MLSPNWASESYWKSHHRAPTQATQTKPTKVANGKRDDELVVRLNFWWFFTVVFLWFSIGSVGCQRLQWNSKQQRACRCFNADFWRPRSCGLFGHERIRCRMAWNEMENCPGCFHFFVQTTPSLSVMSGRQQRQVRKASIQKLSFMCAVSFILTPHGHTSSVLWDGSLVVLMGTKETNKQCTTVPCTACKSHQNCKLHCILLLA